MSAVAAFLARSKPDVDLFLSRNPAVTAGAVLVLVDVQAAVNVFRKSRTPRPSWATTSAGSPQCAAFWMSPKEAISMLAEGGMCSSLERLVSVSTFLLSPAPHGESRFLAWIGSEIGAGVLAVGRPPTPAS